MPTTVRMKIESISPVVIKLIDESQRQRSNDPHTQCRQKVFSVSLIRNPWPHDVSSRINQHEQDRCNNQIARLHAYNVKFNSETSLLFLYLFQTPFRVFVGLVFTFCFTFYFIKSLTRFSFITLFLSNLTQGNQ